MSTNRFLWLSVSFLTVSLIISAPVDENDECGISDFPDGHAGQRIINGTVVPEGKYPWLAFVSVGPDRCTASIVSRKYILTAGHCVCEQIDPKPSSPVPCKPLELSQLTVAVGSVDFGKYGWYKVKKAIHHQEYVTNPDGSSSRDIAILELEEPMNYNKNVRRVCLSSKHQEGDPEKNVVITGWGDINGHNKLPDVLREGTARIADDILCEKQCLRIRNDLSTFYFFSYKNYGADNICIMPHNHTMTFPGDSGGPALVKENGHWLEIGITSYGTGHIDFETPKVNTRVSHFCDWIAEETSNDVQCDHF